MKKYFFLFLGFAILIVLNSCKKNANDPCYVCQEDSQGFWANRRIEICDRKVCVENATCIGLDDETSHEEYARTYFGTEFSTKCRQQ